jgi:molybdopterin adenylyltransferase
MAKSKLDLQGIGIVVLIVSDSCASGDRRDESGVELGLILKSLNSKVLQKAIVEDDLEKICRKLRYFCDRLKADVVLTSGGTGLGPRDVTPEATSMVIHKEVLGLAELMRSEGAKKTRRAALSRSVVGVRGKTLIINLPGSPKGAKESFEAIADLIPHALNMMAGRGH